jgi:hypothetical protein
MADKTALDTLLAAAEGIGGTRRGEISWLTKQLVLARGFYAPARFNDSDWVERDDVEAAWKALADDLPRRQLLSLGGIGGHPGGGWAKIVCAHALPGGGCIYSWETDFADLGLQATLLIATTEHAGGEADVSVAELALSIDGEGLGLARGAFGGACDALDTVLLSSRAVPLLVNALAEIGDLYDPTMEAMAEQAPGHLEPWGHDWMSWLIEHTFFDG